METEPKIIDANKDQRTERLLTTLFGPKIHPTNLRLLIKISQKIAELRKLLQIAEEKTPLKTVFGVNLIEDKETAHLKATVPSSLKGRENDRTTELNDLNDVIAGLSQYAAIAKIKEKTRTNIELRLQVLNKPREIELAKNPIRELRGIVYGVEIEGDDTKTIKFTLNYREHPRELNSDDLSSIEALKKIIIFPKFERGELIVPKLKLCLQKPKEIKNLLANTPTETWHQVTISPTGETKAQKTSEFDRRIRDLLELLKVFFGNTTADNYSRSGTDHVLLNNELKAILAEIEGERIRVKEKKFITMELQSRYFFRTNVLPKDDIVQ